MQRLRRCRATTPHGVESWAVVRDGRPMVTSKLADFRAPIRERCWPHVLWLDHRRVEPDPDRAGHKTGDAALPLRDSAPEAEEVDPVREIGGTVARLAGGQEGHRK